MIKQRIISQQGFLLVTTLWILTIITIAASFFALWTQRTVELAQSMQDNVQGQIDMQSTQANLIYLLTTQRYTFAGLTVPIPVDKSAEQQPAEVDEEGLPISPQPPISPKKSDTTNAENEEEEVSAFIPFGTEIALDDRPYQGHGSARFALQDEGGLINPNYISEFKMTRLLGLLGVEAELRAPLVDKLQDYIDVDDFHRINGAESYHYKQRGLPPPTNHLLRSPSEAQRVLDWAEQLTLWKTGLWEQLTTVSAIGLPNFNTAPLLVLQAVYGFDMETAQRIIAARQTTPFYNQIRVAEISGVRVDIDPMDVNFFASTTLRLTLWYNGAQRMRQVHIQLTPMADGKAPWQVEYALELPLLPDYTATPLLTIQQFDQVLKSSL